MSRKQAYQQALQSQNIPLDLADQCAEILINDDIRTRTQQEQKIINKAWNIAFRGTNE